MESGLNDSGHGLPPVDGALTRIRSWAQQRDREDPDGHVVKARVGEEIAGYLGPNGANRVLEPVTERSELFPAVEPVLAIFLGYRAAARLIRHVIDRAIVRI
jgi:hypothetical protein